MKYQDAINYIYSFVDYSRTHMENLAPENFNLERVRVLLNKLGNPHLKYKVIHIAGSKGKGSTAAMCASILQAAGYRTGLNTSPHLEDFSERIRLDGQEISQEEVIELVKEIKPAVDSMEFITTFEIITVLAMLYFAQVEAEIVCFEVGLGGRLDATNVVDPLISVITSISLEHTAILGSTLAEIAGEKAGIIKQGVPVISSEQKDEVRAVITAEADAHQTEAVFSNDNYSYEILEKDIYGQTIIISSDNGKTDPAQVRLPLIGRHQADNALTAFAVIMEAAAQGFEISAEAVSQGFAETYWPGRLEVLMEKPLIVADGAHNPDSARRLHEAVQDFLPAQKYVLIVGFSGDKDLSGILKPLLPGAKLVVGSKALHPRAMRTEIIDEQLQNLQVEFTIEETIEAALKTAAAAANEDNFILVTGSLFMVGAAKSAVRELGNSI